MMQPQIQIVPEALDWRFETTLVDYPSAVTLMENRVAAIADGYAPDMVWCLEHPPLYTGGTSAKREDLLVAAAPGLQNLPVYQTGRGGQYTYHGPGQRVAYVMMDLKNYYPTPDIRAFVHDLEEWIILTLATFNIKGERRAGRIGIWVVDPVTGVEDKIAALGIRVRRGVAYHGIAINLNPDLSHFAGIVPCGVKGHGVTSFEKLGVLIGMHDLDAALKSAFAEVFQKSRT